MKPMIFALLLPFAWAAAGLAEDPPAAGAPRLQQRFSEADKNQDGVITADESDRPRLFQRLDANGDGRLTRQEVAAALEARRSGGTGENPSPVPKGAAAFESHLNIPYAKISGVPANLLSLDIYTPEAPLKGGYPVVVMVHGGGWRAGDKANGALGRDKAAFFTAQGYVYVSVNYRLSPAVKHPTHAEDVARAVAWVQDHVKEYGGDPGRLTLMGHSAGAHLAALIATDERYLAKWGKSPAMIDGVILLDTAGYDIPRNMGGSSEGPINLAIYENAFGNDPKIWADASPITHVQAGKKLPRFLVFYTDRKSSGPLSRDFAAAVRKTGAPATAILTKGKTHSTLNLNIGEPGDGPSKLILEFLKGATTFPDSI